MADEVLSQELPLNGLMRYASEGEAANSRCHWKRGDQHVSDIQLAWHYSHFVGHYDLGFDS